MIKRIIKEEIRRIDVYELRYNKKHLEIFEKDFEEIQTKTQKPVIEDERNRI